MSDTVQYILQLKDEMSGHLGNINAGVNKLNEHMEHSRGIVGGLQKAFIEFFAVTKVVEFGKDSVKAFEDITQAKTQLDNALKNRDVGFSMEELTGQAEEYSKKWIFSKEQIMATQLELSKFKNIHGDIFKQVEEAGINIGSRGDRGGVEEVTNLLGRALNDPEHGLMRVAKQLGLVFTESQLKQIKYLQETGRVTQAQQIILKQLNDTYKNSADVAAATEKGQKALAEHGLEEVKEQFGEMIDQIEVSLLPDLKKFYEFARKEIIPALKEWATRIKDILLTVGRWIAHHKELVKSVLEFIVVYKAAQEATDLFKLAQEALNITALANPWVVIAASIATVVVGLKEASNLYDQWKHKGDSDAVKKVNREIASSVVGYTSGAFGKVLSPEDAKAQATRDAVTKFAKEAQDGAEEVRKLRMGVKFSMDAPQRLESAKAALAEAQRLQGDLSTSPNDKRSKSKAGASDNATDIGLGSEKITGQKMTNINITMKSLVEKFEIVTNNLGESSAKVREEIVKALVSAVNDSQILAGQ